VVLLTGDRSRARYTNKTFKLDNVWPREIDPVAGMKEQS